MSDHKLVYERLRLTQKIQFRAACACGWKAEYSDTFLRIAIQRYQRHWLTAVSEQIDPPAGFTGDYADGMDHAINQLLEAL